MSPAQLEKLAKAAGLKLRAGSAAEMAAALAVLRKLAERVRSPLPPKR